MKKASFKTGSSGSPKHTETMGSGKGMAGDSGARVSERGPRIGAGVMGKRVQPEYDRAAEGNGGAARGKPKGSYEEG